MIAAVVVVVLAWAGLLAVRTWSAYRHDQQGLARLEQVKASLTPGELTSPGSVHLLDGARAEFASASSDLSSPLFTPMTIVPVIGRQFRSVRALSSAAGAVSEVGASFLTQVHDVLDQPHSAGPDRVASLRELSTIAASAQRKLAAVDPGPSQALVAPLRSKHDEFVAQLNDARLRLAKAAAVCAAGGATQPRDAVGIGRLPRRRGGHHGGRVGPVGRPESVRGPDPAGRRGAGDR
jgi:hypothetical protein